MKRLCREVARVWRAYTRTPRHRARRPVAAHRRAADPFAEQLRERIWTGAIHDWAERRRALYANGGTT
ncbi:hypothetical protein [Phytohabitans rumicis]|uniref:Uncharacterized protein n=1 Tax=Phytohabitans rumicis TaxID=1076125 RepID=A0A6V8LAI0_9ACTN|nr:hypothetical protein [Phytohabitans rumicis]GFJ91559.1 hypothetical protein Prum_052010 [Phytohabitans rumicis]